MELGEPFVVGVTDPERRRRRRAGGRRPSPPALGFDEADAGRVAIVVTEAATNLIKHAGGGEILGRACAGAGARGGARVLALDRGPGIASLDAALRDGYSTAGSAGTGLGAISAPRPSSTSTRPGPAARPCSPCCGRARTATASASLGAPRRGRCRVPEAGRGGLRRRLGVPGHAGRRGHSRRRRPRPRAGAAEAAREAGRLFQEASGRRAARRDARAPPRGLRPRGAPRWRSRASIRDGSVVTFAGVGNIAGSCSAASARARWSRTTARWATRCDASRSSRTRGPPDAMLVLHSDGLASHWNLDAYPGLIRRHPGLIAGVLYRDFRRGRDDVTVVVASAAAPHEPAAPLGHDSAASATSSWPGSAPASRRAARLRRAGPDPHRHGGVRDRPQRLPVRRRRHRSSSCSEGRTPPQILLVRVTRPAAPASADLARILEGRVRSATGMGLGLVGARRLMDRFEIDTAPASGTTVLLGKLLPAGRAGASTPAASTGSAGSSPASGPTSRSTRSSGRTRSCSRALDELRGPAGRARPGSTASWRTPTAASSPSTPSSTRRPTTCGAPTR